MFFKVYKNKNKKGFTLVEIMVASSIFVVVMLIVSGSIVSVISANQKSNNLRSVMDNLNLTLESMTRTIRFSDYYYCGSISTPPNVLDCPNGGNAFTAWFGNTRYSYTLSGGRIMRTRADVTGSVSNYITSPDVTINKLVFKVTGSTPFDTSLGTTCVSPNECNQPKVTIIISGSAGVDNTTSNFNLETTVSQRLLDFK